LNAALHNYSSIEKEVLSVVETLCEFCDILLGAKLNVYTNHLNLTHEITKFSTQRVLCWRLFWEEYGPQFFYKDGESNFKTDALSRVPTSRRERESKNHAYHPFLVLSPNSGQGDNPNDLDAFSFFHSELYACLQHYPELLNYFGK